MLRLLGIRDHDHDEVSYSMTAQKCDALTPRPCADYACKRKAAWEADWNEHGGVVRYCRYHAPSRKAEKLLTNWRRVT